MVTGRALWAGISTCKFAGPWEVLEEKAREQNGRSPESSTDWGVEQQVRPAGREAGLAMQLASGREELGSLEKEGQRSERHLDEALAPTALLAPAGLLGGAHRSSNCVRNGMRTGVRVPPSPECSLGRAGLHLLGPEL